MEELLSLMRKRQLFSEYFLSEGIKSTDDYQRLSLEELKSLFNETEKIYLHFSESHSPDEADTENCLIRPILKNFGFHFSRQKSPSRKGRTDIPDFILFSSEKDKDDFGKTPKAKKYERMAPVCFAYPPSQNLVLSSS